MKNLPDISAVQMREIPLLRDIAQNTFVDSFAKGNSPENFNAYIDRNFTLAQISEEFHRPNSHFYFARIDGQIAGYLKLNTGAAQTDQTLSKAVKKTAEIERIYAKRDFQGAGAGKALMQKSIEFAGVAKVDWLWLGVWDQNHYAIEFYKWQGFEIFGGHDFWMGDELQHDIMMKRAVNK